MAREYKNIECADNLKLFPRKHCAHTLVWLKDVSVSYSGIEVCSGAKEYSPGQKRKVLLAKSLCEQAHLHVWDEPLNDIDILSRIQIEELLMEYGPTMIFVEHDEAFRDKIADKITRF